MHSSEVFQVMETLFQADDVNVGAVLCAAGSHAAHCVRRRKPKTAALYGSIGTLKQLVNRRML